MKKCTNSSDDFHSVFAPSFTFTVHSPNSVTNALLTPFHTLTYTVMFNHILTAQICPITVSLSSTEAQRKTAILGWRQATWCSTVLSYQSCIGCYNSKLCRYRLTLGCQLFKFETSRLSVSHLET